MFELNLNLTTPQLLFFLGVLFLIIVGIFVLVLWGFPFVFGRLSLFLLKGGLVCNVGFIVNMKLYR
jgi:hypothetical protein